MTMNPRSIIIIVASALSIFCAAPSCSKDPCRELIGKFCLCDQSKVTNRKNCKSARDPKLFEKAMKLSLKKGVDMRDRCERVLHMFRCAE